MIYSQASFHYTLNNRSIQYRSSGSNGKPVSSSRLDELIGQNAAAGPKIEEV
jgi:hypothetical protein